MLTDISPKLPMRDKAVTLAYCVNMLGFRRVIGAEHADYLMVEKDKVQLHFFLFAGLDPLANYGQVYLRTDDIDTLYRSLLENKVVIHPAGYLQTKPWGQREFALLDPDHNLLTFGQRIV